MSVGGPSNLGTLLVQRLDAVLGTPTGQQATIAAGAATRAVPQTGQPADAGAPDSPTRRLPEETAERSGAGQSGREHTRSGGADPGSGREQTKPATTGTEGSSADRAAKGPSLRAAEAKGPGIEGMRYARAASLDDLLGRPSTSSGTTPSAPTTLGYAARIILNLFNTFPQVDARIAGRAPLITADRTDPANEPDAQAMATRLARSLSQSVRTSGLFYESHLAQWVLGQMDEKTLRQEPQSRLNALRAAAHGETRSGAQGGAGGEPARQDSSSAPAGAGRNPGPSTLAGAAEPGPGNPASSASPSPSTSGAQSPAERALAGQTATVQPGGGRGAAGAAGQTGTDQTGPGVGPGAIGSSHTGTGAAAGIDPQLQWLVRQQLEVLARDRLGWQGEAWPGAPMEWEIERRPDAGSGRSSADRDSEAAHWATRVALQLPTLGAVEARLALSGSQLMLRIAAPDGQDRIRAGVEDLRARLGRQGLHAERITVSAQPVTAGSAEAAHEDGDGEGVTDASR